jgi:hypothetical protein
MKKILESDGQAMKIFLVQGNLYRKSGKARIGKPVNSFGLRAKDASSDGDRLATYYCWFKSISGG